MFIIHLLTAPTHEPFRRSELKEGELEADAPTREDKQMGLVLPWCV